MKTLLFVFSILVMMIIVVVVNGVNGFNELTNPNCVSVGVMISPQSDQGQCGFGFANSTTGVGSKHHFASISEGLFQLGVACGTCWQLTGPGGSVTVIITNMCSSQNQICNSSVLEFIVGEGAFSVLSKDTNPNSQLLYDITARPISCETSGPLKIKMTGSNVYSINVFAYNMNYALDSMSIYANGWYSPIPLIRNPFTSSFQLQSPPNNKVLPPVLITATSVTGESLSLTILGSVVHLQIVLFPSNFVGSSIAGPNSTCAYVAPSGDMYHDSIVGYGWSTQSSINFMANLSSTDDPFEGPTCMSLTLGSNGYVEFSRSGGFKVVNYTDFTFAVRASEYPLSLSLYTSTTSENEIYYFTADTDWSVIQVSLNTLIPDLNEGTLIWGLLIVNNGTDAVSLYLDNVALINTNDPSSYPLWDSTNTPPPNQNPPIPPTTSTSSDTRLNQTVTTMSTTTTGEGSSLLFSPLKLLLVFFLLFVTLLWI